MNRLQEIIDLCQREKGKVFVLDSEGNVSLVMLSIGEYRRLTNQPQKPSVDTETINKQILKAQLEEVAAPQDLPIAPQVNTPQVRPKVDLREDVIDPSFDFED